MTVRIRPILQTDRDAWGQLYAGYAAFYEVSQSEAMRDTVFDWVMDPAHDVCGLVAENAAGVLVGLTHYRRFFSPLSATERAFLDDLFVTPEARGTGAAAALIDGVCDAAKAKGWELVRWITADDNHRARSLYDKTAKRTMWVTYDRKL